MRQVSFCKYLAQYHGSHPNSQAHYFYKSAFVQLAAQCYPFGPPRVCAAQRWSCVEPRRLRHETVCLRCHWLDWAGWAVGFYDA